jgi:YfiH family protein
MEFITPNWSAPGCVHGFTSTRRGGVSSGPYADLNLALHVDDDPGNVATNRERLCRDAGLPGKPQWPEQCHGTRTVHAGDLNDTPGSAADAVYADAPGLVCAILTADCLPLIVCSLAGDEIAVIHAGWRGLLDGIIESALSRFSTPPERMIAWIGPGISARAYAVDHAFREQFVNSDPAFAAIFSTRDGQLYADLPRLAAMRLDTAGLSRISRYRGCTYGEPERFFSYRRDGITGRIATCAWLGNEPGRARS